MVDWFAFSLSASLRFPILLHGADDSTTLLTSQDATEDNPVDSLLADPEFWSILYPGTRPPFVTSPNDEGDQGRSDEGSFESFGKNQTAVRRGGWSLVHTLAKNHPGSFLQSQLDLQCLIDSFREDKGLYACYFGGNITLHLDRTR